MKEGHGCIQEEVVVAESFSELSSTVDHFQIHSADHTVSWMLSRRQQE